METADNGGDPESMIATLDTVVPGLQAAAPERLPFGRGLDFDVLVPSISTAGDAPYVVVDRAEVGPRIDELVERIRA